MKFTLRGWRLDRGAVGTEVERLEEERETIARGMNWLKTAKTKRGCCWSERQVGVRRQQQLEVPRGLGFTCVPSELQA
jgi:hypothetical protein